MRLRYILIGVIFSISASSSFASERYLLGFELIKNDRIIERGTLLVSKNQLSWKKGLKRSYLKLRCIEQQSGKIQKSLSTEDFFAGLEISHQLHKNNVIIKVVHTDVQPQIFKIQALKKNECKAMAPIITKTKQAYSFQAIESANQKHSFGDGMFFRLNLKPIGVFAQ